MNTRRAVAYLRVSTDDQALGPEAQRASIRAWAQREGVELVGEFSDLGVSGAAALDRRPGLLAAVDALERGDLLVVAKRCRLTRDPVAGAMVERLVDRAGGRIVAADGVGEGDGPEALLLRRMVDAFAEYERALIRGRTRAALAVKAARGERVGGVPYGRQVAADGRTLEANEAEAELVSIVLDLRAAGLSYAAVAAELEKRGFRTRKGGRIAPTQVTRICERAAA